MAKKTVQDEDCNREGEKIAQASGKQKIDPVAQKIEAVRLGEVHSVKLSNSEHLSSNHIVALCDMIKMHKLDYLEVPNGTPECLIKELVTPI